MNRFIKLTKGLLTVLLILLVIVVAIFLINDFTPNTESSKKTESIKGEKEMSDEGRVTPIITTPKQIYNEPPAKDGADFFEKLPLIEGQQAYVAYPLEINPEKPPRLILYNHGSNFTISTNFEDQFMKDMRYYGEYFTGKGYAFAASNQHGNNDGSQAAIDDNNNLIDWIREGYRIQQEVNLIGFSMGGRPTIYFTQQNSENVNAIALLAPATCNCSSDLYTSLKDIPIKIWHGTADAYVRYSAANEFFEAGKPYNLNITLRTVDGAGHFDIDTEMIQEIYEFFKEHESGE